MGRLDLKQHDGKWEHSRRAALGRRFGSQAESANTKGPQDAKATNWSQDADSLASYPSEHGSSEQGDSAPNAKVVSNPDEDLSMLLCLFLSNLCRLELQGMPKKSIRFG